MHGGAVLQFRSGALPVASPPLGSPTRSPALRGNPHRLVPVHVDAPTGAHVAGSYGPPGHALSGPPAEVRLPSTCKLPSEKRQRKERGPNWGLQEILALVVARPHDGHATGSSRLSEMVMHARQSGIC
jgi:hypothetical protein